MRVCVICERERKRKKKKKKKKKGREREKKKERETKPKVSTSKQSCARAASPDLCAHASNRPTTTYVICDIYTQMSIHMSHTHTACVIYTHK